MQNKLLIAALGAALAVPAFAADSYTIDPRHTHPTYEINHFGWSTQRGRFDNVTGKITLDRAAKSGTVDCPSTSHRSAPAWPSSMSTCAAKNSSTSPSIRR